GVPGGPGSPADLYGKPYPPIASLHCLCVTSTCRNVYAQGRVILNDYLWVSRKNCIHERRHSTGQRHRYEGTRQATGLPLGRKRYFRCEDDEREQCRDDAEHHRIFRPGRRTHGVGVGTGQWCTPGRRDGESQRPPVLWTRHLGNDGAGGTENQCSIDVALRRIV